MLCTWQWSVECERLVLSCDTLLGVQPVVPCDVQSHVSFPLLADSWCACCVFSVVVVMSTPGNGLPPCACDVRLLRKIGSVRDERQTSFAYANGVRICERRSHMRTLLSLLPLITGPISCILFAMHSYEIA